MGISKATALARLADDLGIRKEEIMAIGDGNNDLEMLEFAGLSVAMANAKVAVKKIAQVETSSNDQSGVAQAILKYALNSSRLRDEQI